MSTSFKPIKVFSNPFDNINRCPHIFFASWLTTNYINSALIHIFIILIHISYADSGDVVH